MNIKKDIARYQISMRRYAYIAGCGIIIALFIVAII